MADNPPSSPAAGIINAVASLISAAAWPLLVVFLVFLIYMRSSQIKDLINDFMKDKKSAEISVGATGFRLNLIADESRKAVIESVAKSQSKPLTQAQVQEISSTANAAADQVAINTLNPRKRLKILWIDDHPENNVGLQYAFQSVGIVVICIDSNQLLSRAFSVAGGFDLVITDMGRDEVVDRRADEPLGGLESIEILKETHPSVPVMIYAANYAEKHAKDAVQSPVIKITNDPQVVYSLVVEYAKSKSSQLSAQ